MSTFLKGAFGICFLVAAYAIWQSWPYLESYLALKSGYIPAQGAS